MLTDKEIACKYVSKIQNAKSRGINFNLLFRKFKQMLNTKTCKYTKVKFITGHAQLGRSIDRIDSSKGYTDDNVIVCTKRINMLKDNLTKEEIIKLAKVLQKLTNNK
jgi:hypothetical protein